MSPDRFDSREDDLSFLTLEYAAGMIARSAGTSLEGNPYHNELPDGWKYRLWRAGWADQDMIQIHEVITSED